MPSPLASTKAFKSCSETSDCENEDTKERTQIMSLRLGEKEGMKEGRKGGRKDFDKRKQNVPIGATNTKQARWRRRITCCCVQHLFFGQLCMLGLFSAR